MLPKMMAFLACLLSFPAFAQQPHRGELKFEPFALVTFDGQSHPAELGHLSVPENRGTRKNNNDKNDKNKKDKNKSSARLIQIAFIRLKSSATHTAAPIVFLAGGPGIPGSGISRVPVYYELFEKLRQVADVILLDQRGSGMSSPNLNDCPASGDFPADAFANRQKFVDALAHATSKCSEYWRKKAVDVTAYNTEENADDIDDLRQALGAEKISLLGHSYGTELGLAVIRRHGAVVERAALAGAEGPGDHDTTPSVSDLQLQKISDLVASSANVGQGKEKEKAAPDLVSLFRQDRELLQKQPASITIVAKKSNQPVNLTVGSVALEFFARQMLADGRSVGSPPALLQSVSARDYSLLQGKLEGLYNGLDSGITLMGRTMDCSGATPAARLPQIENEARASLFNEVSRIDVQPEVCQAAIGAFTLDPQYFASLYSLTPTLFLNGSLDANTPPMKAEHMRWGFPHSTYIVIENGFHETLPDDDVQAVVVDFFKGQDVSDRRVKFEVPRFLSLDEAKQRAARPH
jgi:pimeloyl-ACP methyl ester carboxylesterase